MPNIIELLISSAWAQAAAAPQSPIPSLVMLGAFGLIFWFMLIRPQMKRQKEHRALIEALGKGDEVVTSGGVLGKIIEVGDAFVVVEIANNVQVRIQKHAISAVMPKGTIKAS